MAMVPSNISFPLLKGFNGALPVGSTSESHGLKAVLPNKFNRFC